MRPVAHIYAGHQGVKGQGHSFSKIGSQDSNLQPGTKARAHAKTKQYSEIRATKETCTENERGQTE